MNKIAKQMMTKSDAIVDRRQLGQNTTNWSKFFTQGRLESELFHLW
jgi:hypothetical protein